MSKIKKIFPLTEDKQAFQKAKISKELFVFACRIYAGISVASVDLQPEGILRIDALA